MALLNSNIKVQRVIVVFSIILFLVKMFAWYITSSVAILTDALESTVNVVASVIGLYSLILSAKPKDKEHPYGHGKIEFISSAIEGILIVLAGSIIIFEAVWHLYHPKQLHSLDYGLILVAFAGAVNYVLGVWCVNKGKSQNSPILLASGSHLKSDTYSTLGLLIGIALILITDYLWLDSVAAIIFAFIIIYTGFKILKKSFSGIMDESDKEIINEIILLLNKERQTHWIDIHNMRVINYAGFYHIDCHLTVPFYINVNEAHAILDTLTDVVSKHFNQRVEFFVHIDGCVFEQCNICHIQSCEKRQSEFIEYLTWDQENILSNKKHKL
ncbi:MAG: cation diffusion facilitator family transporter [Bacteroidota bacterium]|nr:cation diffusion facilitator family transporter [Bacteroidota bacterium]